MTNKGGAEIMRRLFIVNKEYKGIYMKPFIFLLGVLFSFQVAQAQRIVVLSPDVADVVVALGHAKEVVGKNSTDRNPALKEVKVVGLHRSVTPESVLGVDPDLVLGSWMVQPASIFERLQKIGVRAVNVAPKDDFATYAQSIREIGKLIGAEKKANQLADQWLADMNKHTKDGQNTGKRFLLSYDGRIVGGKNTVPDKLIELAGGINAGATVDGLKPLSREGWLASKPDVIVISDHHAELIGGVDGFSKRVEIADSNAVKNKKVVLWPANDYFRYGLDTPKIVQKLHDLAK